MRQTTIFAFWKTELIKTAESGAVNRFAGVLQKIRPAPAGRIFLLCNFGKNYALPLSLFAFAKKNHAEKVKLLRVPVKGQGAALCKLCNVDAIGGHTAYAKVGKGARLAVFSLQGLHREQAP